MLAPRMRVLTVGNMYPPHHLGGYELMWQGAVTELRRRGCEVRVLTTDYHAPRPDPGAGEDPDVHRELRWYWHDHEILRLSPREQLALQRHNGARFEHHRRDFRPDVVSWWAMGGMSLSLIGWAQRAALPAVGFVHDEWMGYARRIDAWERRLGRPLLGSLAARLTGIPTAIDLSSGARWLFVSAYVRDQAVRAGVARGDEEILHSGIDLPRFALRPERAEWSGRLLFVGRMDERKGLATAIEALSQLPDHTLRVVGGGDDRYLERIRRLAVERDLSRRVSFEELSRDEIPRAYELADALIFPATWPEPFGLVPLEAMAAGAPVVATGTGGSAEYLRDGENCVLFAPGDACGLAAAVARLRSDRSLRRRLREHGRRTAEQHTLGEFAARAATATIAAAHVRPPSRLR